MIPGKNKESNSDEWTPFIHNLITLHFMDNGTSVKIYSENINKNQTIKPINGSSSQECALALKGLDVNDWDIGMDIADLRKLLFQDDALYYFIKWKNFASDHSEEIRDIKEFLDKMNYKLKGVLFWIDGFWTGGDFMNLHEQMTNNLAESDYFLQTGIWDTEPSVNAILACLPPDATKLLDYAMD